MHWNTAAAGFAGSPAGRRKKGKGLTGGDKGRPAASSGLSPLGGKTASNMNKNNQMQNSTYTFTRSQIQQGDVREFLVKHDPAKLTNERLAELFGGISLHFAGVGDSEVASHSELRILLRRLHAIWPWSAYFMDLDRPLGPAITANNKPLLALALCVADRWCDEIQARRAIKPQLQRFKFNCHEAVDRLAKRAGLNASVIQDRHQAVTQQLQPLLGNL